MGTIARRFYFSINEQDFVAPGEVDIRKLQEVGTAEDGSTICIHPNAAGITEVTQDPYTTTAVQGDLTANLGWAINRLGADGMDSLSLAKRSILSGVWSLVSFSIVPAASLNGSFSSKVTYKVYKVLATGNRVLLFSTTSNSIVSDVTTVGGTRGYYTATFSAPEYILEENETIHIGMISVINQTAGLLGATVETYSAFYHNSTAVYIEVPAPGITTVYKRVFSILLSGIAAKLFVIRLTPKIAVLAGMVSITKLMRITKVAAINALVTSIKFIRLNAMNVTLTATSTNVKEIKPVAKTVMLNSTPLRTAYVKPIAKVGVMSGISSYNRLLIFARYFSATFIGTTGFSRALIAVRVFSTATVAVALTYLKLPQAALNRIAGSGGTTVIRKIFGVFD